MVVKDPMNVTNVKLRGIPTIEEVMFAREIEQHATAAQAGNTCPDEWGKRTTRQQSRVMSSGLPPERIAVEQSREMQSRLSHGRKRSRPGSIRTGGGQATALYENDDGNLARSSLPYLRPLTGASPPQSRRGGNVHRQLQSGKTKGSCGSHCPVERWTAAGQRISRVEGEVVSTKGLSNNQTHLVQVLTGKCTELVNRLKKVEQHVMMENDHNNDTRSVTTSDTTHGHQVRWCREMNTRPKSTSFLPKKPRHAIASHQPTHDPAVFQWQEEHIHQEGLLAKFLKSVSAKVERLVDVYTDVDALEAKRTFAAATIISFFRRLCRIQRYKRYQAAVNSWRRLHAPEVCQVLSYEMKRQRYLNIEMAKMAIQRKEHARSKVFIAWLKLARVHLPRIQRIMQFAENRFQEKRKGIVLRCLKAWWGVTSGPQSCRWKHKILHERQQKARERLQAHNHHGEIITKDLIAQEVQKIFMEEVAVLHQRNIERRYWRHLEQLHAHRRALMKQAQQHHRIKVEHQIFYPWRRYAFLEAQGIARMKWKHPGRYEVRYNQLQVDTMARRRLLERSISAWRRVTSRYREAHRRFRTRQTSFVRAHLHAWHHTAARHMQLRRLTLTNWREYGKDNCETPFRAWWTFTEMQKKERAARDRIVYVFRRSCSRKWLCNILRFWRHQALYGRTETLCTRLDLIRSLGMHKEHTRQMLEKMHQQELTVSDMYDVMDDQIALIREYEEEAHKREQEALALSMSVNHAEQEVVRMQNLVECVTNMFPAAAAQLQRLQPGFNFRDRGLADPAHARREVQEKEAEERMNARRKWVRNSFGATIGNFSATQRSLNMSMTSSTPENVLPERIQWVLALTDFRHLLAASATRSSTTTTTTTVEDMTDYLRILGLFEFMRTGDESALKKEDAKRWHSFSESRQTPSPSTSIPTWTMRGSLSGGQHRANNDSLSPQPPESPRTSDVIADAVVAGVNKADPHREAKDSSSAAVKEKEAGQQGGKQSGEGASQIFWWQQNKRQGSLPLVISPNSRTSLGKTVGNQGSTSNFSGLIAATPDGGKRTWSNFLVFLNAHLPPHRRTETTQEQVTNRVYVSKMGFENILLTTAKGEKPSRDFDIYDEKDICPAVDTRLPESLSFAAEADASSVSYSVVPPPKTSSPQESATAIAGAIPEEEEPEEATMHVSFLTQEHGKVQQKKS